MPERERALNAFYSGLVCARHREAANATLKDNDNVLLLLAQVGHGSCANSSRLSLARQSSLRIICLR
jgi:hypothetical protein